MDLKEYIKRVIKGELKLQTVVCQVDSVDKAACSCVCTPLNENPDMNDVRLRAALDGTTTGFIVFPKVNSSVIVGIIEGMEVNGFVMMCSDVDSIQLIGSDNKGLVMVSPLVDKVNTLENKMNAVEQAMATHVHMYVPASGTPTPTTPASSSTPPYLQPQPINPVTSVNDLQNPNVVH